MRVYYDFHIHSCLSPCGDEDMTPNNIVNMSLLKGLDIIAVTDHNCAGNVKACQEAAKVTEEQMDKAVHMDGRVYCPHCGRYSDFHICNPENIQKERET